MAGPTHEHGFRLSVDGSPFAFDYRWKTTQQFAIQTYDPDATTAADLTGVTSVDVQIFDRPDGTSLKAVVGSAPTPADGIIKFALATSDLATLAYDLGERVKVVYVQILLVISGADHAVWDSAGNRFFPMRVHWGAAAQ
jgi:hypothetical protein